MDYALSFGVGRQTSFRPEDVTQSLPVEDDILPPGTAFQTIRSPFPFAAKQMTVFGPFDNLLNRGRSFSADLDVGIREQAAKSTAAMEEYNRLPADMVWSVAK